MRNKILLPVDGSEHSKRAVKYVGDVISGCEEVEIVLYHALQIPPVLMEHGGSEIPDEERRLDEELKREEEMWEKESREKIDREIFSPAKQILKESGIREALTSIRTKLATSTNLDVAQAIIQEAEEGGYGTVAMGKRGITALRDCLLGSVTSKVVHHTESSAVWIVV